jgi:hypothetical protein
MDGWVAEFDRAGLLMYWSNNGLAHNQAWYAYHPNGNPDFFTTHTKPFFIKRIGGLTVYSTQKRLSQEMVDQYYAWYYKVFGKRLKRPKGEPLTGEAG